MIEECRLGWQDFFVLDLVFKAAERKGHLLKG
jgi:hypothetical protein